MSTLKQNFGLEMMKINWRDRPKRMAVFVSKYDHCLVSLVVVSFNGLVDINSHYSL